MSGNFVSNQIHAIEQYNSIKERMLYSDYIRQVSPSPPTIDTHKIAIPQRWTCHNHIFSPYLLGDATKPHLVPHYTGMITFHVDAKLNVSISLTFIWPTSNCLTLIKQSKNTKMNKTGERHRIREHYMVDKIIQKAVVTENVAIRVSKSVMGSS